MNSFDAGRQGVLTMFDFINTRLTSAVLGFALSFCSAVVSTTAYANVSQSPLLLGGGSVPGNLVLSPSVEFPTVISVANLGDYSNNATYTGYFDSNKCYDYIEEAFVHPTFGSVSVDQGGGYFSPVSVMGSNRKCGGKWSGNYLNWATTQTIDPFRKALTGGYRSVDTPSKTILEKATRANRNSYFPDRSVNAGVASSVSPYRQELKSSLYQGSDDSYQRNKAVRISSGSTHKFYSVRVEVCKKSTSDKLLESNCKKYENGHKPEGLLQQYSDSIRYSVFSYLNIDGNGIDGGVLRAQQDYIGETRRQPDEPGIGENPRKEWDPKTGKIFPNPHDDPIGNSGVLNYINKFGELTNQHKSNDPVSELYYAALRYLRGKRNLSSYSSQATSIRSKDYFPVLTEWIDPIQYACQKNAILGIGDVNTHEDRDLLPSDDIFMDLNDYTNRVFNHEGINKSASAEFTGRGNSAYIAGLAYFANTQNIRPDMAGKQTASTYWVDVRENEELLTKDKNQYWLAAKYGGFEVPDNYTLSSAPPLDSWNKSNEVLSNDDLRPDNFYVASDAENMVRSLEQAFAQIANEVQSTTTSLAANSSRLETDTAVFQSKLDSKYWSGDLQGLLVESDGNVASAPVWSAAEQLDNLSVVTGRNILTIKPPTGSGGAQVSTTGSTFTWDGLTTDQQNQLKKTAESGNANAKNRLEYLRGDRSNEMSIEHRTRPFRQRGSRLGDIVNSDPQFVHKQDYGYSRLTGWGNDVAAKYKDFRSTEAYVSRVPMIIAGANDGMLHGFNASVTSASGGEELFAFVPNGIFHNLLKLTEPSYAHRYYVDGTPRVSDAWLGSRWATVAVGSTGAGGKSIFSIDLTNVSGKSSVSATNVMWEFTHPEMGYTIGQPAIVALPNEKFGVIVSSGYHDEAPNRGYVWVLNINDGSVIKEFEIPTTGNLGAPLVSDLSFNQEADRVYVADTLGKVWRLDLASSDKNSWGIPSSLNNGPLFIAKDASGESQAITAPLSSAYNHKGEHMLLFGTGSFYRNGDNEIPDNPKAETFYGIFDKGIAIEGRGSLLQQKIIEEAHVHGKKVRAVTDESLTDDHQGWFLDLAWDPSEGGKGPDGERVIAKASLRSDRVLFTTMTPTNDPCAFGGTSMIMALDLISGKRLPHTYFDINNDGELDDADDMEPGSDGSPGIPWSGVSDVDDGVIKGVSTLHKWICFAGSSGSAPKCMPVSGSMREGRQSWREVRAKDE